MRLSSAGASLIQPIASCGVGRCVTQVLYKRYLTSDTDPMPTANANRFFGVLGLMTLLTVWPMFFILDVTEIEPFLMPSPRQAKLIAVIAVCDTAFNAFLLLCILLTSPLFTSVGTILVIPITSLVGYLAHGTVLPAKAFAGVAMIVSGFLCIVAAEHRESVENRQPQFTAAGEIQLAVVGTIEK